MSRGKRSAFTLVELLVVISIIGMLVALLLPAVNNARLVTQRTDCMSRMVQMSKAMDLYEPQNGALPGYRNFMKMNPVGTSPATVFTDPFGIPPGPRGTSWVIPMLPYLERNDLYQAWRTPVGATSGGGSSGGGTPTTTTANVQTARVYLQILTCPTAALPSDGTPLSYVLNTGMIDSQGTPMTAQSAGITRDYKENGVFHDLYQGNVNGLPTTGQQLPLVKMTKTYISSNDGVQNTLLLSENIDAGNYTDQYEHLLGFIWAPGQVTPAQQQGVAGTPMPSTCQPLVTSQRINDSTGFGLSTLQAGGAAGQPPTQQSYNWARPSSNHPSGVNMCFADGRGTFISDQIEYWVYCLLMSPRGKMVRMPGTTQVLPYFDTPVSDQWIRAGQ